MCAQVVPVEEPADDENNIIRTILPFVAYTSDFGLFGAIIFQQINYGENQTPYLSSTRTDFSASTRGKLQAAAIYERINLFDYPIRHTTLINLLQEPDGPYYGIGNDTEFTDSLYDEGIFFYRIQEVLVNFTARRVITNFSDTGKLDGVIRAGLSNRQISSRGADTLFEAELPFGAEGGWVNKIGVGLITDKRNSEFDPTEGFRYEAGTNFSSGFTGSDFTFAEYFADLRHYYSPFRNVVLAHKVGFRHSSGDVPFWQLPVIGNEKGLRGYVLDRFIGDSSVLQILELRTWLFSVLEDQIRIGGNLFWDSGRVFSRYDSNKFFDDWNHTFGFGTAMTVINPDIILRFDAAFSDESFRFYTGLGYLF